MLYGIWDRNRSRQQLHKHLDISQDKQQTGTVTGRRGEQVVQLELYGYTQIPSSDLPALLCHAHILNRRQPGNKGPVKGSHRGFRSDPICGRLKCRPAEWARIWHKPSINPRLHTQRNCKSLWICLCVIHPLQSLTFYRRLYIFSIFNPTKILRL